jgi:voltage-gated potassium channel
VWFIFLGTAYQLIIQRLIEEWRMTRLQSELRDHLVLCGFGHSGSIAASELLLRGWSPGEIVVIDSHADEVQRAADRGFIGLHGDASSEELLKVAAVDRAHSVIVSVGRDDTTVLVVLTIREIARQVRVVARVGEQENVKLVRASGADVIVSPPRFGGYLMADAIASSATVDFVAEALTFHGGFQLHERDPAPPEIGRAARELDGSLVVEIRRGGRRIGCWQDPGLVIERDDRLLVIDSDAALRAIS